MNSDFHYYGTYCAAFLAGYSHEEALRIAYSACFVDYCSKSMLMKFGGPKSAATMQTQLELFDSDSGITSIQDITRIWASFHFLPGDLYAKPKRKATKSYRRKYRLLCQPNGELLKDTVNLAKGSSLEAAGLAMHVLADTWAHQYYAGTPSLVMNDVNSDFFELVMVDGKEEAFPVHFRHNPAAKDDPESHSYVSSMRVNNEISIMNLGHGRAGHLPDYSFAKYRFMPPWGDYKEFLKDNPYSFMQAFCQMVYALKCLRENREFECNQYEEEAVKPYRQTLDTMFRKRQIDSTKDWREFAHGCSGEYIPAFDANAMPVEYQASDNKDMTPMGQFIFAALRQKSMVTNRIYSSGNPLAGSSKEYRPGQKRIQKDFRALLDFLKQGANHE